MKRYKERNRLRNSVFTLVSCILYRLVSYVLECRWLNHCLSEILDWKICSERLEIGKSKTLARGLSGLPGPMWANLGPCASWADRVINQHLYHYCIDNITIFSVTWHATSHTMENPGKNNDESKDGRRCRSPNPTRPLSRGLPLGCSKELAVHIRIRLGLRRRWSPYSSLFTITSPKPEPGPKPSDDPATATISIAQSHHPAFPQDQTLCLQSD